MPSGYSRTPLAKKLGIKEGFNILLYNEPLGYLELFEDLPDNLHFSKNAQLEEIDFIHAFCTSLDELSKAVKDYKPLLKKNGLFWISWPKGKSKITTKLKRDLIRTHILEQGLVDVKVASIDENWSGLKFVYRVKDR